MTCIVGLVEDGTIYMGGDSAAVCGNDLTIIRSPKVFINGDFLIGFTSSFRMGQLLQYELAISAPQNGMKDREFMVKIFASQVRELFSEHGFTWVDHNREAGGRFLVGYHGKLYTMESDFAVTDYDLDYAACGSGEGFAMGAMYASEGLKAQKRIKQALKAAAAFSTGVSAPFKVKEL